MFFLNVRIEGDGFYLSTGLFDDRYYNNADIKKWNAVMKVYKHHRRGYVSQRMYYSFTHLRIDVMLLENFNIKSINGYEIELLVNEY